MHCCIGDRLRHASSQHCFPAMLLLLFSEALCSTCRLLQMRAELAKVDVLVVPTSAYNYTVQEIQASLVGRALRV